MSRRRPRSTATSSAGVESIVYTLYDSDKSGRSAAAKIEEKLLRYSANAPISVTPLAVTPEQISEWRLPTRPAKEKGEPDAVELDAIPPNKLIELVENAIVENIDENVWRMEQVFEDSEREILAALTEGTR